MNLLSLNFFSFFIFLVKPGCLKCLSGMNISLANKNVFTFLLFHSFYILRTTYLLTAGSYLMEFLSLNISIIHLLLGFLTNIIFLLSHTPHVDKRIIFPLFVFSTLVFSLSIFFLQFKTKWYVYSLIFLTNHWGLHIFDSFFPFILFS